jgi:hypothetical protein
MRLNTHPVKFPSQIGNVSQNIYFAPAIEAFHVKTDIFIASV